MRIDLLIYSIIGLLLILLLMMINIAEKKRMSAVSTKKISYTIKSFTLIIFTILTIYGINFIYQGTVFFTTSNLYIGITMVTIGVLGLLLHLPRTRLGIARILPLDPNNYVHQTVLPLSLFIPLNLFLTLSVGLGNISQNMRQAGLLETMMELWLQTSAFVLLAAIGVGFLTRRTWSEVLNRLGLHRVTWEKIRRGIIIGAGGAVIILLFQFLGQIMGITPNAEVEEITNKILRALYTSIPGVLTIGFAAAIGEEILFRGALQPKLGLIYTALLFSLFHTTYGLTISTLVVFVVGILLGKIRQKYDTTTSIIVHATYNMIIVILANLVKL